MRWLVLCLLAMLTACASHQVSPSHQALGPHPGGRYKIGLPYRVGNQWYTPRVTTHLSQTGLASWYGPHFNGKRTANGEVFDMNKISAAHKTLPLPSIVRVTNLENGRSLVVRVNDRGPYVAVHKRIIDLSKRAAELLGYKNKGLARVRVDLLPEATRLAVRQLRGPQTRFKKAILRSQRSPHLRNIPFKKAAPPPWKVPSGGGFYLQVGAYAQPENAMRVGAQLRSFGAVSFLKVPQQRIVIYRVRLGPWRSLQAANRVRLSISRLGYTDAKVMIG